MRLQILCVVTFLLACRALGQSTTTQTIQANIYATPGVVSLQPW